MKKYNLEFCFKGSRTYVQGPDIFDAVVEKIKKVYDINNIVNIKYSAHEMLHKNADLYFIENFRKEDFINSTFLQDQRII